VGIRGVGGQGILFFGRVLTQLAFIAGYGEKNVVKGETHGMAQMGGPVISTFACGDVYSPVLMPGTADVLIALEKSEILRAGFLETLHPEGTVLLAETKIVPFSALTKEYPPDGQIEMMLHAYHVVKADPLTTAIELGDPTGRLANVVMLGLLSTMHPFDIFPLELWYTALKRVNSRPDVWAANYAAFNAGRGVAQPIA
jgi:indolepyruvate ferredoxin oxidoreductase alpha subunit